jgi:DUF4097 and DUF4098 domain-containing protein YvlB
MAGYPPPYPPPPNQPYGYDPKQQARVAREQIKAQIRAQKSAFRAQRDLYRYQTRSMLTRNRRSSILAPLLILGVGVVVLLMRLGRIPTSDFGDWYGRWWPLFLVGAGVILVAEWAWDQTQQTEETPYVRRGVGGGAVLLLILLAFTGVAVHAFQNHHEFLNNGFVVNSDDFNEIFGEKHEMSSTAEAPFPAGSTLEIDNPHGDVTIVGKSGDDKIHITVNKHIYSSSDSDADSKADQFTPRIDHDGSTVRVTLPSVNAATSDLDITVPDFAETTVTANHGDVAISAIHAPVNVTSNHGDVELNSIIGAVTTRINHRGSTFAAHQITGNVSVQGHADDMTVTDVTGQTSLEGEFYGDTHFERLRGPVNFHTSRTQLSLIRLDGELNISPHSDLSGDQITGPTLLKTRSRNVTFDRIAGDIDVTNSDGSVDVTGAPPLGNVSVENKNGEVSISVPEHSNFSVEAETKGGEISNDLNLKSTSADNRAFVSGTVGHGGPRIVLHTTHLDIGIHEKDTAPLAPPAPPAPAPKPPTLPKPPAQPKAPPAPKTTSVTF